MLLQQRTWWDQQSDRELHGVHMANQPLVDDELENLAVVAPGRPGCERDPGRPNRQPHLTAPLQGHQHVVSIVPLFQNLKNRIGQSLDRRNHEHRPTLDQFRQHVTTFDQVLDFRGEVECDAGKPIRQATRDSQGVSRTVEKIGVGKRDVTGTGGDLLFNVGQHDLRRHRHEPATINRGNRAVGAKVPAPTAGLDRPSGHDLHVPIVVDRCESRVLVQAGQRRPIGHGKLLPLPAHLRILGRLAFTSLPALQQRDQLALDLPSQTSRGPGIQQRRSIEHGVEAQKHNSRFGILFSHRTGHSNTQLQRGVHWHGDHHDRCTAQITS